MTDELVIGFLTVIGILYVGAVLFFATNEDGLTRKEEAKQLTDEKSGRAKHREDILKRHYEIVKDWELRYAFALGYTCDLGRQYNDDILHMYNDLRLSAREDFGITSFLDQYALYQLPYPDGRAYACKPTSYFAKNPSRYYRQPHGGYAEAMERSLSYGLITAKEYTEKMEALEWNKYRVLPHAR